MKPQEMADFLNKKSGVLGITGISSDATVREKQELQKKQKTLEIIQQNFTVLLDAPEISSDLLPAKKEPVSVTREK